MTATASALLLEHDALVASLRTLHLQHKKYLQPPAAEYSLARVLDMPSRAMPVNSPPPSALADQRQSQLRADIPQTKRARAERYKNYVPEEETIRNDYCQRYVDSGDYPQNWVLGAEPERRFEEYPKQQRLLALKKDAVAAHAVNPTYTSLFSLARGEMSPAKFDVILLDPPYSSSFTFDSLAQLPIPSLAADPSFVFLWVGSGTGDALERGREVLAKWGYRRCEDIVWVKTNRTTNHGPGSEPPTSSLLTRTKQHCLMGIRGTVRRSTDGWFVHCNVDTDVIVWEGDPQDPTRKPPEMYSLIENFCLGLRRLEVFGRAHSLRPGWVTVGDLGDLEDNVVGAVPWIREEWEATLVKNVSGKYVVPTSGEIDMLRPKSPVRNTPNPQNQHQSQQQQQHLQQQHSQQPPLNPQMMMPMQMPIPVPVSMGLPMNPMMMAAAAAAAQPHMFNMNMGMNNMNMNMAMQQQQQAAMMQGYGMMPQFGFAPPHPHQLQQQQQQQQGEWMDPSMMANMHMGGGGFHPGMNGEQWY